MGKAQYMYWFVVALICYSDGAAIVTVPDIMPLLTCEWDLDILWATLINVNFYFFNVIGQ